MGLFRYKNGIIKSEARVLERRYGIHSERELNPALTRLVDRRAVKTSVVANILIHIVFNKFTFVLLIALSLYVYVTVDSELNRIAEMYSSLTAAPLDSKIGFDKRLHYIVENEDGTTSFEVGSSSELKEREFESAYEEVIDNTTNNPYDGIKFEEVSLTRETMELAFKDTGYEPFIDNFINSIEVFEKNGDSKSYGFYIGLFANVASEGKLRRIESITETNYPEAYRDLRKNEYIGKTFEQLFVENNKEPGYITTVEQCVWLIKYYETQDLNKPGVGLVQWSGSRRDDLLKMYIEVATGKEYDEEVTKQYYSTIITDEIAKKAEMELLYKELKSNSYYFNCISNILNSPKPLGFGVSDVAMANPYQYACAIHDAFEKSALSCTIGCPHHSSEKSTLHHCSWGDDLFYNGKPAGCNYRGNKAVDIYNRLLDATEKLNNTTEQ